jgi:hypothetical protein
LLEEGININEINAPINKTGRAGLVPTFTPSIITQIIKSNIGTSSRI